MAVTLDPPQSNGTLSLPMGPTSLRYSNNDPPDIGYGYEFPLGNFAGSSHSSSSRPWRDQLWLEDGFASHASLERDLETDGKMGIPVSCL